jgi:hypothetical protein
VKVFRGTKWENRSYSNRDSFYVVCLNKIWFNTINHDNGRGRVNE